jgi:hypothetical protein
LQNGQRCKKPPDIGRSDPMMKERLKDTSTAKEGAEVKIQKIISQISNLFPCPLMLMVESDRRHFTAI